MNKYTGEVDVTIDGEKYKLILDYRAQAEIQSKYGKDAFKDIFQNITPALIADILVAGLKKHHPNITLDWILDVSPPLVPMTKAIDKAMLYAFFGADGVPETSEETPENEEFKKKTA